MEGIKAWGLRVCNTCSSSILLTAGWSRWRESRHGGYVCVIPVLAAYCMLTAGWSRWRESRHGGYVCVIPVLAAYCLLQAGADGGNRGMGATCV